MPWLELVGTLSVVMVPDGSVDGPTPDDSTQYENANIVLTDLSKLGDVDTKDLQPDLTQLAKDNSQAAAEIQALKADMVKRDRRATWGAFESTIVKVLGSRSAQQLSNNFQKALVDQKYLEANDIKGHIYKPYEGGTFFDFLSVYWKLFVDWYYSAPTETTATATTERVFDPDYST